MDKGVLIPRGRHMEVLVDSYDQLFLSQFGEYVKDLMYLSAEDRDPLRLQRYEDALLWSMGERPLPIAGDRLTMDQALEVFLDLRPDLDIHAQDRILDTKEAILDRVRKYREYQLHHQRQDSSSQEVTLH